MRNWLIGLYIVEFEQNGQDRAKYRERLLPELAASVHRMDDDDQFSKPQRPVLELFSMIQNRFTTVMSQLVPIVNIAAIAFTNDVPGMATKKR